MLSLVCVGCEHSVVPSPTTTPVGRLATKHGEMLQHQAVLFLLNSHLKRSAKYRTKRCARDCYNCFSCYTCYGCYSLVTRLLHVVSVVTIVTVVTNVTLVTVVTTCYTVVTTCYTPLQLLQSLQLLRGLFGCCGHSRARPPGAQASRAPVYRLLASSLKKTDCSQSRAGRRPKRLEPLFFLACPPVCGLADNFPHSPWKQANRVQTFLQTACPRSTTRELWRQ